MTDQPPNPSKLLAFMRQHGPVESRLKETSDGDVEFLQWGTLPFSGLSLDEQQILDALNELHLQQLLVRSENVTPGDTCEYIVSWDVLRGNQQ